MACPDGGGPSEPASQRPDPASQPDSDETTTEQARDRQPIGPWLRLREWWQKPSPSPRDLYRD